MAEDQPSLHIDTDWKKQAQEEKRRLAEQAAKAMPSPPSAFSPAPAAAVGSKATATSPATGGRRERGSRDLPPAGFAALVQSLMTQVLYYLGDLATTARQPAMDLDMAKHQLDTLGMLEEKTRNNLSDEEKRILDAALYETRSRFVNVASQLLGP